MNIDLLKALPRPLLKLIAAFLLIPATLSADFDLQKYDALLWFIAALYAFRGTEKVADMVTKRKEGAANG